MTAVREPVKLPDNFLNIGRMEIPRPQYEGMTFIQTRGRVGFYKSIRQHGAQFGLQVRPQGPRRPALNPKLFVHPNIQEQDESSDSSRSPVPVTRRQAPPSQSAANLRPSLPSRSDDDDSNRSSQLSDYSDKSKCSSPVITEPEVPAPDYDDAPTAPSPPTNNRVEKF